MESYSKVSEIFDLLFVVPGVAIGLAIVRICQFYGDLITSKHHARYYSPNTALMIIWSLGLLIYSTQYWFFSVQWKFYRFENTFLHYLLAIIMPISISLMSFTICRNRDEEGFHDLGTHFKNYSYLFYALIGISLLAATLESVFYQPAETFGYQRPSENAVRVVAGSIYLALAFFRAKAKRLATTSLAPTETLPFLKREYWTVNIIDIIALAITVLAVAFRVAMWLITSEPRNPGLNKIPSFEQTFAFLHSAEPLNVIRQTAPATAKVNSSIHPGVTIEYTTPYPGHCIIRIITHPGELTEFYNLGQVINGEIKLGLDRHVFPGNDGVEAMCKIIQGNPMCYSNFTLPPSGKPQDNRRVENAVKYLYSNFCRGTHRKTAF